MTLVNKEIVLQGFNGGTDETDDRIIWVCGDDGEITRITQNLGDKVATVGDLNIGVGEGPVSFEVGQPMGIDYDLPKDEAAFIEKVKILTTSH